MDHQLRVTVRVDVEQYGLDILSRFAAGEPAYGHASQEEPLDGELTIIAPDVLPECLAPDDCPCGREPVAA